MAGRPPGVSRRHLLAWLGGAATLGELGRHLTSPVEAAVPAPGPASPPLASWKHIRREFLFGDDYLFLDNAATGACPRRVLEVAYEAWRRMEAQPAEDAYGELLEEAEAVRERLARFLGAGYRELLLTANTTDAMSQIAQGIRLEAGDRVLTTDHEHPGGRRCWEYLAGRAGVVIDEIDLPTPPDSPEQIVALLEGRIVPRTRVISVSHVTFDTGLRLPIRSIARLARARGLLLVVDGAQVPGGMQVDLGALGCDAYATSAHKWLLAPKGTGALYVRLASRPSIEPIRAHDGYSVYTGSTGLPDLPAIIGLGAAVDFLDGLGMERVEAHNMRLREVLYRRLSAIDRLRVLSPPAGGMASPIVAVELPRGIGSRELRRRLLERHRISVRALTAEGFEGLRFTAHVYNRAGDYDRLAEALVEELREAGGVSPRT